LKRLQRKIYYSSEFAVSVGKPPSSSQFLLLGIAILVWGDHKFRQTTRDAAHVSTEEAVVFRCE